MTENPLLAERSPTPFSSMTTFNPQSLKTAELYRLMIGSIVPRPIAFISTQSKAGQRNLAPFSYFNGVSSSPPCISICFAKKANGEKKDSLVNIEETGEFVVNTVSTWFVRSMVQTAAEYPYGVDEMQKVGLTPLASEVVGPPRVKESPVHLECKLYKLISIGDDPKMQTTMVIGEIVRIHLADTALSDGRIQIEGISPVARLGGAGYGTITNITQIPTPQLIPDNCR